MGEGGGLAWSESSTLLPHLLTTQTTEPMMTPIMDRTWLLNGLANVSRIEAGKIPPIESLKQPC